MVITPRTVRSGETAFLKIATRNIEELHFTAYGSMPTPSFRRRTGSRRSNRSTSGWSRFDASWTSKVADYARYKPADTEYPLKKLELPGVFVVKGE